MIYSVIRYNQNCSNTSLLPRTMHALVYTDGSCTNNGRDNPRAGIGVYWPKNPRHNVSQRLYGRQTNQRAEIVAALKGVRQAQRLGYDHVTVRTDSNYVVKAMNEWIPNRWLDNGWKNIEGGTIKNKYDFVRLYEATQEMPTIFEKVGRESNQDADELAREGTLIDTY